MRPTQRLIILLVLWTALALGAAFFKELLFLWFGYGCMGISLLLIEILSLRHLQPPQVERQISSTLSLGEWHPVILRIHNTSSNTYTTVETFDGVPSYFDLKGQPQKTIIPIGSWVDIEYRIRPQKRGEHQLKATEILLTGRFALMRKFFLIGQPQLLRVYPNFKQVSKLAMLAVDNRTAHMGIHMQRRRGEGTEFYQLRDYREGDSLRQIDWKAVSRRNQLISRDYREEQNQHVLFLLDCGRRMHSQDGKMSHFDQVLNALLLLSYVALRNGDGVGLLTFSSRKTRWLPPLKGVPAMNNILNAVFDLETSTAPSDFSEAAFRLNARQKRRALVIVMTNLRDDDSQLLPEAFAPLRKRHLILTASIYEPILKKVLEKPIEGFEDALRISSTYHYLAQRRKAQEMIRGQGITILDVEPAHLPISLVNSYIDIKKSGIL